MSDKDLLDAWYRLSDVPDALSVATTGTGTWWRGEGVQKRLSEAVEDFGLAAQHLAETEVPIDAELLARSKGWAADSPKAAALREDRDAVLKLLGAVEFLVESRGLNADQTKAEWFSEGGSERWDRVKHERQKISTNRNAG